VTADFLSEFVFVRHDASFAWVGSVGVSERPGNVNAELRDHI
jgi:hypothetical protein